MRTAGSWDIFCRVVDNYGDIAVCWRLARQLCVEHGAAVRLWVDNLARWQALCPGASTDRAIQTVDGVEVRRWTTSLADIVPADVAVEGFGCGIPDDYAAALAARRPRALWITLEYLSAEAWVREHHGLPSPHPRIDVDRCFFFPGFGRGTGGLLREADLLERRDRFDAAAREAFWHAAGCAAPVPGSLIVSLFGYAGAPVAEWLDVWEQGAEAVVAAVPAGVYTAEISGYLGGELGPGQQARRGALEIRVVPFLAQSRYDELLWACDLNIVRGEDSFVRAQWAARPMLWHAYPQRDNAHWPKLGAFLDRYCAGLDTGAGAVVRELSNVWNRVGTPPRELAAAWRAWRDLQVDLSAHARRWAADLARDADLATQLAQFCRDRLK